MAQTTLSGWKELSTYMGFGVRTVQRWEQFGLPVHRVDGKRPNGVIAFTEELDYWMMATPTQQTWEINQLRARVIQLIAEVDALQRELCLVKQTRG